MSDDLLEQMRRARETQERIERSRDKEKSESRVTRMSEDVTLLHRFILQFVAAFQWSFVNVGLPVWRAVRWPFWKLFKQYRRVWSLVVYRRDEFDNLRFSKVRAGVFLSASAFFLYFLLVPMLEFTVDASMYAMTARKNETIYLSFSQEIDPENNVHSVKGSESKISDELNGFYFRVESSLFNQLWSLWNRGTVFYPDYVASAIPPGISKCVTTSYGIRVKTFMRRLEVYPHLLSASCQSVNTEATK